MKMAAMCIAASIVLGGFGLAVSAQSQGQASGPAATAPATTQGTANAPGPNAICPRCGMPCGYGAGRGVGARMGRGAQMGGRGMRLGPQDGTGPRRNGSCIRN